VAVASAGPYASAPRSRQITMPAPHCSVFTGRMPFLSPNQQRQSTEGLSVSCDRNRQTVGYQLSTPKSRSQCRNVMKVKENSTSLLEDTNSKSYLNDDEQFVESIDLLQQNCHQRVDTTFLVRLARITQAQCTLLHQSITGDRADSIFIA